MDRSSGKNYCVKCVITGDTKVGKTCLSVTQASGECPDDSTLTDSIFENYAVEMVLGEKKYLLGMFDVSSKGNCELLRAFAYERSDVFLLCFSVVRRDSFENVKSKWLPELKNYVQKKKPILVVGLQTDLRESPGVTDYVSTTEGRELAANIGALCYKECSTLSVKGIRAVFDEVLQQSIAYKKRSKYPLLYSPKVQSVHRKIYPHVKETIFSCLGAGRKEKNLNEI